jgi:predicted Zn-dependent protease
MHDKISFHHPVRDSPMANAPTTSKQPSPFRRAGFFRRSWYRLRDLPKAVTLGLLVLLAGGAAVVGFVGYNRYENSQKTKANIKLWQQFEAATKEANEPGMREALQALVQANPNDPLPKQRLQALDSGEADPNDPPMAMLTYQQHLRAAPPRWPEADREARKYLANYPKDWQARCVVAQFALINKQPEEALKQLDQLPDPNKDGVNLHPGGLLMAFNLFAETQKDPTALRQFVALRVVDRIRSIDTKTWPLPLKLSILDCYVRAFNPGTDGKQLDGLNRAVAPMGEFLEHCRVQATADKEGEALQRLGYLTGQIGLCYGLLHKDGVISDEQHAAFLRELDERSYKTWRSVVELLPKSPAGYKGVAIAELKNKNPAAAREIVARGLEQCGESPDLLSLYSQLLRADNNAKKSVQVMAQAALKDPKNLVAWLQLAEAASAAGEFPVAAEAIGHVEKLAPDDPRVVRAGVWLSLEKKDPIRAVHLLNRFDKSVLMQDAVLAGWYVRGMIDGGLTANLPDFLKSVEQNALQANKPGALGAALNAVTGTARHEPDAVNLVVAIAQRAPDRWSDNPEILTALAMAHYRLAENSDWELAATKNAVRALERLRAKYPENTDIAAAIAWAKLKGEKNPNRALLDAAVLADAFKKELPLNGFQLKVLGTAYSEAGRSKDALAVLKKAAAAGPGVASIHIALAMAYYKAEEYKDAESTILLVRTMPRSPAEQADFAAAMTIIKPSSPAPTTP